MDPRPMTAAECDAAVRRVSGGALQVGMVFDLLGGLYMVKWIGTQGRVILKYIGENPEAVAPEADEADPDNEKAGANLEETQERLKKGVE